MKKIIFIVLGVCILFVFTACSSKNVESSSPSTVAGSAVTDVQSSTQSTVSIGNTIAYEDVKYRVNPLLDSSEEIDYIDIAESEDKSVTGIEIGWERVNNDGYKDILLMYYGNTEDEVKNGNQNILGSVHGRFYKDDRATEWEYYGAEHNLIYKTNDYQIYDKNNNLIGYIGEDGISYDNSNNPLDISSFDPFIKIVDNVDLDF